MKSGKDESMGEQEVVELMRSSRSEEEWNANCDKVKAAHRGQYPIFWWRAIMLSGVLKETQDAWRKT